MLRKRRARAADRELSSRQWKPKDPKRRRRAERDIYFGLQTYFPKRFYHAFTEDQRSMIEAILYTAKTGEDQAIAASRGDGKTAIAECVIILLIAFGVLRFPVIFGAAGREAEQILQNIKEQFEDNNLLDEDFPEITRPIRAMQGANNRARTQTVDGALTRMEWSGDGVRFPRVKGSKAGGAILKTRGLDGAIRGVREGDLRPDFALIDDPDTEESAKSALQQATREATIEHAIGGLGGPGQKFGRLMLCTLINDTCIAARFTDPKQKPSWRGRRIKFLQAMPDREDLWSEYVLLRKQGQDPNGNVDADAADVFYKKHREAMDSGAIVSNPHRARPSKREVSSLQFYYNELADKGLRFVQTELQNDPPAEDTDKFAGVTPALIQRRLSGYPKNVIPRGRLALTTYIDVGWGHKGCHFLTTAWYAGARGCVIEYGVAEVNNAKELGNKIAVERALQVWREERMREPYQDEDGSPAFPDLVLVDSGDGQMEESVYRFVVGAGRPFRASKGFGSSKGQSPFRPQAASKTRAVGDHFFESLQPSGVWLVGIDVDYWKEWVHDRLLTEHQDDDNGLRPGSLTLFTGYKVNSGGEMEVNRHEHVSISHHWTNEVQERVFIPGRGMTKRWVRKDRNNDYFDGIAGSACAARMCGVTLTTIQLQSSAARASRRALRLRMPDGRPYLASRR